MLKKSLFSPARPESAKTAYSPKDAPFTKPRSRRIEILNVPIEILGGGSPGGVFPFAKIHCTDERPHEVRSLPPPVSTPVRPCWTAFLSILRDVLLASRKCLPAALQVGPHADRQISEITAYAQIELSYGRFRCQSGKSFLGQCLRTRCAGGQDVADTIPIGMSLQKKSLRS